MNIDNLKPIGAFLEYTVRPLLDEFKWVLLELEKKGIPVTEQNISRILRGLIRGYVLYVLISFIQAVVITGMICLTALAILKG
jgi:hypothetical protein